MPLDRQITELNGEFDFYRAELDPKGNYLLYKDSVESSVILVDLGTGTKSEFVDKIDDRIGYGADDVYGFSTDGSLVWAILGLESFKIKNLLNKKTTIVPISEDGVITQSYMSEDRSKLLTMSIPLEVMEVGEKLDREMREKGMSYEEIEKAFAQFWDEANINILNILDVNALERKTYDFNYGLMQSCMVLVGNSMILNIVRKDGSLYQKSLVSGETVEIFDPIEGLEIFSLYENVRGLGVKPNCYFMGDRNTVVIEDLERGRYILRLVNERKQFVIKGEELFGSSFGSSKAEISSKTFRYPYHVYNDSGQTLIYHIPSGKLQTTDVRFLRVGQGGKLSVELINLEEEEKRIQIVFYPFDPSKRKVLMEKDLDEFKYVAFNKDRSLAFIGTVLGDLFIIDVNNGEMKRYFFGEQFRDIKISDSGGTFFLKHERNENTYYRTHRFQQTCVQPMDPSAVDIEKKLMEFIALDNPADESFLAFLTGILQDEEVVKKHSELIQSLLWNIFLHYPVLYLDLSSRYQSLELLPPFTMAFLFDNPGIRDQVKKSLNSVFELQTRFSHTRFSDWSFVNPLKPLLHVLSKTQRDIYIERITESISNGATMVIPLFKDVFQSKLFYVIYAQVKAWFGLDSKPVSDITIVRGKKSFSTVILSSKPIENYPSIETDFGIHYALVKEFSRELSIDGIFSGMNVVDGFVQWSLLGEQTAYRAHVKVNIQDQYEVRWLVDRTGPDYEGVWKDQKMTGLIVVGSSLRSFSRTLLENYRSYFKKQGFQFSEINVPDFKPFLEKTIGQCEIDYFLKESHSDGDERNVFRFDRVNSVLKGVRSTEQGREEVVYLAFPKPFYFKDRKTSLLSNLDLAELVSQREKRGCGEITYFNTSCWSHVKARYEIESVNSPLFINIPSISLSDTFLDQEGDAIYELVHSYRNGLDFKGFRKSLEKNEGYRSGKVNRYIFPDEKRYSDSIFEHISIPLRIQIDLQREKEGVWESISPDEAL